MSCAEGMSCVLERKKKHRRREKREGTSGTTGKSREVIYNQSSHVTPRTIWFSVVHMGTSPSAIYSVPLLPCRDQGAHELGFQFLLRRM